MILAKLGVAGPYRGLCITLLKRSLTVWSTCSVSPGQTRNDTLILHDRQESGLWIGEIGNISRLMAQAKDT